MNKTSFSFGKCSDVGILRNLNEDNAMVMELRSAVGKKAKPVILAAVADGMGGHAAGEVASQIAIDTFTKTATAILSSREPSETNFTEITEKTFDKANAEIYRQGRTQTEKYGMGTTLTTILIFDRHLCIGHVGDSRAYLVRNGKVRQLTKDHTVIQEKLSAGLITPEEARYSEERNQLLRAIGVRPTIISDIIHEDLKDGDAIFLCTDGLHNCLEDHKLADIISKTPDPQTACNELVTDAKIQNGSDNITVVCVQIEGKHNINFPSMIWPKFKLTPRKLLVLLLGTVIVFTVFVIYQIRRQIDYSNPLITRPASRATILSETFKNKETANRARAGKE